MAKKSLWIRWLLIGLTGLILPGCWDYREIEKLTVIGGTAVDKNPVTGGYIVTVETINVKAGGDGESKFMPDLMTYEGTTIFEAVRKLIMLSGKKIYWSHAKVLIISQEIAKEGILSVLDFFSRDFEIRKDSMVAVSMEPTAREIFTGSPRLHDLVSLHLDDMLNSQSPISTYPTVKLYQFTNTVAEKGVSAILPTVKLLVQSRNLTPQFDGTAIFKKDRLAGYLDGEETKFLLLIRDELHGGLFVKEISAAGKPFRITFEIFKASTKVKPFFTKKPFTPPSIRIDVTADVSVGELMSSADYLSGTRVKTLQRDVNKWLSRQIIHLIKKVQQDWGTDIFGFASKIEITRPDYMKQHQADWDQVFSSLSIQVKTKVSIRNSAALSKPLQAK